MNWTIGDATYNPSQYGPGTSPSTTTAPSGVVPGDYFWLSLVPDAKMKAFIEQWMDADYNEYGASPAAFANAFYANLLKQSWWQTHSTAYRAAEEIRLTDPATWAEQLAINNKDAAKFASDLGVELTDDQLDSLASNMSYYQWTDAEVEQNILEFTYYGPDSEQSLPASGSIKDLHDSILSVASSNLVTVSDDWAWRMAHDIKTERVTSNQVTDALFDLVDTEFDFIGTEKLAKWRTSDTSISDQLNPVLSQVKTTWGVDDLDLQDDWFKQNLIYKDDAGEERFVTSQEAKALAMKDDRYKKTSAHVNNMQGFTSAMSKILGVY